ncbi:MAG: STT3 domain-containing protein, partial [Dehalococcoidales bacterium]|nr:STT3 domain-containing protein [Dehalococcoidales bacterium]
MRQSTLFSPKLVAGILVALAFGVALYFRIAFPYDKVFVDDLIKFTSFDPYYHMRLVDSLVLNFPYRIPFDPYAHFPDGVPVTWAPFFDWLLAGIILMLSLGSPTQHTVDVIGVYFPAVLGALTVIPVFFIGKVLFNRWVGVIAAGLVSISPGEFMSRSILGFTDHHIAEVFFTTVIMLFFILAVKSARQKNLTFCHLKRPDWTAIAKPLVYTLLTGVFLGIFILTWVGAPLFVFIIFVYFLAQFTIDHRSGISTDYLVIVGIPSLLIATAIALPLATPFLISSMHLVMLALAILAPAALAGISRLLTVKRLKPVYSTRLVLAYYTDSKTRYIPTPVKLTLGNTYLLTLAGIGLVGLLTLASVSPVVNTVIMDTLGSIFRPHLMGETVLEMQSIFFPSGNFSFQVVWGNFTTGFFLSLIALGILIYQVIKHGEVDKTLLVVWSLIILAATIGQRRFAYYMAVNVALLTGYVSWLILEFAGFKKLAAKSVDSEPTVKKKDGQPKKTRREIGLTASPVYMSLGLLVVFFISFFPNIGPAKDMASQAYYTPSDAWYESLTWLNENTPEPFGDADFYYELYEPPSLGESYDYPESAYGVMAWWDYGHWITRIGRRPVNASPATWGICATFFGARDEATANATIHDLGIKYVIADYDIAFTKFHAIPTLLNENKDTFYELCYQSQEGKLRPITLFHLNYYLSFPVRLYNFNGQEVVVSEQVTVISSEGKTDPKGN